MYQTIVLGLGFLLLFGAGYLIKNIDKEGVVTSTLTSTQTAATSTGTSSASTTSANAPDSAYLGTFICGPESGCASPSMLTVQENGEVSINTSYDNGVEMVQERGTWKSERGGGMTIVITGTDSELYAVPRTIFVKYATQKSLAGLSFDAKLHPDWLRPVFRKQEADSL